MPPGPAEPWGRPERSCSAARSSVRRFGHPDIRKEVGIRIFPSPAVRLPSFLKVMRRLTRFNVSVPVLTRQQVAGRFGPWELGVAALRLVSRSVVLLRAAACRRRAAGTGRVAAGIRYAAQSAAHVEQRRLSEQRLVCCCRLFCPG